MRSIVIVGMLAVLPIASASAQRTVTVRGHVNRDGTYVPPHVRTAPNATRTDNWSSRPNVNPYTGETGTVDPYAPKPYKPLRLK